MKTDKTDKMIVLTKEQILERHRIKPRKYLSRAMQEHTDQAIAEYKRKLKEAIEPIPHGDGYLPYQDIIELIDTTTI